MPNPELIRVGEALVDAASGGNGLVEQSAKIMSSGKSLASRAPVELDFEPARINSQVDKALGFDQGKAPWYSQFPAVERFPMLQGTDHPTYDVAIAGGGLFGTQTARVLAAEGKKVVVLEGALIADGASGALAGMGTRGLDASYPELREQLGDEKFGAYIRNVRKASMAIRTDGRSLSESRSGISSHMCSYEDNDLDLRAEYQALHRFDRATTLSIGPAAEKFFPAVGDRPAAGTVMSFLGESRVNPRQFSFAMLNHPNITTFEHSPIKGIRTGLPGEPIEVHTDDGVVKANTFVSATGNLPSMFAQHVPLLGVEQARMIRGVLPENTAFTRDNYFDFGNPVSRNDEDYAWWLMPKKGEVYLGADSRFLTDGDRATQGIQGVKENMHYTFPGVTIPRGEKSWGSVIYGTSHGGPLVETLPENPNIIAITGGGGTGLVNGRQAAWSVRNILNGSGKNELYSASTLEHLKGD